MKCLIPFLFVLALSSCITLPVTPTPSPSPSPSPTPLAFMAINEGGHSYWDNARFSDAKNAFSGWFPTKSGQVVTYDANGYPTAPASCISFLQGYPAGDYQATWDGTATITFRWAKKVVSTGPNSAVVTYGASNQTYLDVTGLDPAHPFTNLHIWAPGYGPTSPMYLKEYIAGLQGFSGLRTMPSSNTNSNTSVNWSDRVKPTDFDWADKGIPMEADIELIKETGIPAIWVNIPIGANADYMTQLATLLHSQLPAGTRVMVEMGNELWNWAGGFNGWPAVNLEANTTNPALYDGAIVAGKIVPDQPGKLVTDSYTRAARAASEKAYQMTLLFQKVYADQPQNLIPVWGGQAANVAWATDGLVWIAAKYGSVPFKALAIAPYFDPKWNNSQFAPTGGFKTATDLATASATMISSIIPGQLQASLKLANQYGMQLVDYEGGQSLFPLTLPYSATDPATVMLTSPVAGTLYDQYLAMLKTGGVSMHFEFVYLSEPWSKSGYWSALQTPTDTGPTNYRWQSILKQK